MIGARPPIAVWILSRSVGAPSQVWLDRQVDLLRRVRPLRVAWEIDSRHRSGNAVVPVPFPYDPRSGFGRWVHRAARSASRNFYAASRRERMWFDRLYDLQPPGVILCHFGPTALRILPMARRWGVPVIAYFHGVDITSALQNRWYRWSLASQLDSLNHLIAVGERQAAVLKGLGADDSRISVIPMGVPVEEFSSLRNTVASGPGLKFVTVGRLVPQKGIDWVLRAFSMLDGDCHRLTVVGDGPDLPSLVELSRELGVQERVSFLGAVGPEVVRAVLEQSDVYVQHSLDMPDGSFEGFGVAAAEASAMNLPLVVSKCGGLVEQVVDGITGLIVEQRDVEALRQAMEMLSGDGDLRVRLGRAGRERVSRLYDARVKAMELEEVLITAAGSNARGLGPESGTIERPPG